MSDYQFTPGYKAARGWAESQGVPTTASFMVVATRVVNSIIDRRAGDKQIGDEQLAREVAREAVTDAGNRMAVQVCLDNDRLRCVRLPANPDMPSNPSVEDLCEYVLLHHLLLLAKHTALHGPHRLPDDQRQERGGHYQ